MESRKKDSDKIKHWSDPDPVLRDSSLLDEYLIAMKRGYTQFSTNTADHMTPRERRRCRKSMQTRNTDENLDVLEAARISTIVSMVPDEIIYKVSDYSIRIYESALMFVDISGFTDLCETYTKAGRGGPSKLTQVLNSYIGSMVQEILSHNGDVLKFSGDAFISMWKKTSTLTMHDVVHTAIDCGLIIQKNYGRHATDIGVILKVKVGISAGVSHFAIVGDENTSHYVLVGQPVWDVKAAEYMSSAGDVLTSNSTWMYVNEAEYCTEPCGDGKHTKVLGVGASWKRVEKIDYDVADRSFSIPVDRETENVGGATGLTYREYSLRPAVIAAIHSSWWPLLRRFMIRPVLMAVDNDEPMDFLTEVRHVVVVFINIITKTVTEEVLIAIVDTAYKCVCSVTTKAGGLVNKLSMFDKDMMFLVVFGLRGLKHEDEAQKALLCAYEIKERLNDPNIISVSIGITSGTTYCGVVGHVLRREYTVIGSSVNKAARLMMNYNNKVACDKETFVRSKLGLDFFRLMEKKALKGIAKPGPIYEFNSIGWANRIPFSRHPILGRNEELRKYKMVLQNALKHQHEQFTTYRDHKYAVAIIGPNMAGKSRLMDEFLSITPHFLLLKKIILTKETEGPNMAGKSRLMDEFLSITPHFLLLKKIILTKETEVPYGLIRMLMAQVFMRTNNKPTRDKIENRIRHSLSLVTLSALQIYALNTIFDCRFPLPENFDYTGDLLSEYSVRIVLHEICTTSFPSLRVVAVEDAQYIDDESWRILLLILGNKNVFFILEIEELDSPSKEASRCMSNEMIVKIHIKGIDRWYHAALVCQLLDVQALPADLEKVIESASNGLPGWIQNFVIALVQRGDLTVVTVTRGEAQEAGAVFPAPALLQRPEHEQDQNAETHSIAGSQINVGSLHQNPSMRSITSQLVPDSDLIQMAVLSESCNFNNLQLDMTMDVIILKTYDSLTPFEKMLLKCASVLGDVFSRRMLLHLLHSDSPRKVAQAVAKLFSIRVLECEGGDFTHGTSMVLVHPAPTSMKETPPYCACLGTRPLPNCRDLPMYAFCGYIKFRHSLFRTTTYELLTESQKLEMHTRALLYLERYARRCTSCGGGCFNKIFGIRFDDGLVPESKAIKRVRQQIAALTAETRISSEMDMSTLFDASQGLVIEQDDQFKDTSISPEGKGVYVYLKSGRILALLKLNIVQTSDKHKRLHHERKQLTRSTLAWVTRNAKRVRTFSSYEWDSCECMPILLSLYSQVIVHCRAAGEFEKMFETYIEYADLCILNLNIPQAIRLLLEVEEIIEKEHGNSDEFKIDWMKDYRLARILTLRGTCMLELGDHGEAKKNLLHALKLLCVPFPISKLGIRIRHYQSSFHQFMSLYVVPGLYVAKESGITGKYYDDVARTLTKWYRWLNENKKFYEAYLAAKWSLNFARKSNSAFRLLCVCYANLISVYCQKQKFSMCSKLEKEAMAICYLKRGQPDVTEVHAVCSLYTNIFLVYVECGNKMESLDFGLSVIPLLSTLTDLTTYQILVLWMLKLLLTDLRINEMVTIMRQFLCMSDHYDFSSETWYYVVVMVILLDTGYCVESYRDSEKYFIKKGDGILRSKTPEAAWIYFVSMWLVTIRVGAWERSILWEEKINIVTTVKITKNLFCTAVNIRMIEGFLITLVREIDNRNLKKIQLIRKTVKDMFKEIDYAAPLHRPRYLLMLAYEKYIAGKKSQAFKYLNEAFEVAKQYSHGPMLYWIKHTRAHWTGNLPASHVNYWVEHVDVDLLNYTEFNMDNPKIVPYTLPLPRDLMCIL